MTSVGSFFCCLVFFAFANLTAAQYEPKTPTVEPLANRGIRISIPDEPGITLVAFHVKINEDFQGLEAGTIARDIVHSRNGRWTYQDRTTKLRIGDIVYYWLYVIYEGLGYNVLDQQHQVTEFFDATDGAKVTTGSVDNKSKEDLPCAPTDTKLVDLETGGRSPVCAGQLLLNEQFDSLNETIWRKNERFTGLPDYAFVVYRDDDRNVKTANGHLEIKPTPMNAEFGENFIRHGNMTLQRCTGEEGTMECHREARGAYILPPVLSGLIDTKNSFAFIYGKIEIRAKLPRGDWIYPLISLERLEKSTTSGVWTHPQLRVASSTGNPVLRGADGADLSGHVLYSGPCEADGESTRSHALPKRYSSGLWSDDYHIYELEWRRDKIFSRVDGLEYGSKITRVPFDRPFYLNLGVAVGGHDEFPDLSTSDGYAKPWRNVGSKALFDFFNATELWARTWNADSLKLQIDYVKVWAL